MDPDPPRSAPRKVKFAPKPPPRRTAKPITTNMCDPAIENDGDDEETQQSLSRRVSEHLNRRGPKIEKKSSVQVAFQHGGGSSTALRTFGPQREQTDDRKNAVDSKESVSDHGKKPLTPISTDGTEDSDENMEEVTDSGIVMKKREYREPWDYKSYYPITLPLRKPNSGDPEILDKEEFEKPTEYDENTLISASELDLLDKDDTPKMLFFQFPSELPLGTRETVDTSTSRPSADSKGKGIAGSAVNKTRGDTSEKGCSLEEIPEGYMGKMLVYKNGSVKLKLGNVLLDVSPGPDILSPQSVVAMNTSSKHCCELGQLKKQAVVSIIDFDSILD